jgi:hypothetical protein
MLPVAGLQAFQGIGAGQRHKMLDKHTVFCYADNMERADWIAICAHRLQQHWRTVDPLELELVAADLWADLQLRAMAPAEAATVWLKPVETVG